MQAFALDNIVCQTGFFTLCYTVIDITDYLHILFRVIDAPYVSNCLKTVQETVLPHALQTLQILSVDSADQRAKANIHNANKSYYTDLCEIDKC